MATLNTEWATTEIDKFLHVTAQVSPNSGGGVVFLGTVMRGPATEASQRAHVVEQILDRVLPAWSRDRPEKDGKYSWLRDQASRARAALEREAELGEKLGDNAPDLDAANLHPWAWENGRSYWNTGHYHQAVMQAAIRTNAEVQAKLGRMDVSETALFNEAFSLSASKEDAPRLRLAENDGSKTYENLHRGARAFAEGLYAAIRNPGMHAPQQSAGGEEQLVAPGGREFLDGLTEHGRSRQVGGAHLAVLGEDQADRCTELADVERVPHHGRPERLVAVFDGLGCDPSFPLTDSMQTNASSASPRALGSCGVGLEKVWSIHDFGCPRTAARRRSLDSSCSYRNTCSNLFQSRVTSPRLARSADHPGGDLGGDVEATSSTPGRR
jgi:hypothetical protein